MMGSFTSEEQIDIMNISSEDEGLLMKFQNEISDLVDVDLELAQSDKDSDNESIDVVNLSPNKSCSSLNISSVKDNLMSNNFKDFQTKKQRLIRKHKKIQENILKNNLEAVQEKTRKRKLCNTINSTPTGTNPKQKKTKKDRCSLPNLQKSSKNISPGQKTMLDFFSKITSFPENLLSDRITNSNENAGKRSIFINNKHNGIDPKNLPTAKIVLDRNTVKNCLTYKNSLNKKVKNINAEYNSSLKTTTSSSIRIKSNYSISNIEQELSKIKNVAVARGSTTEFSQKICHICPKCRNKNDGKCSQCGLTSIYECLICARQCMTVSGMRRHVKNHHPNKNSIKKIKIHKKRIRKKKPISVQLTDIKRIIIPFCSKCNKRREFSSDKKAKCQPCSTDSLTYKCAICKTKINSGHGIINHVKVNHTDDWCMESNKEMLKCAHIFCCECNETHKICKENLNECPKCKSKVQFGCNLCKRTFRTVPVLGRHIMQSCCSKNMNYCNDYDYKRKHKSNLKAHISKKHVEQKEYLPIFECSKCQKNFGNKYKKNIHEKMCGLPPHLICKFCPYKIRYRKNIKNHIRNHHVNQLSSIADFDEIIEEIAEKGKILLAKARKSVSNGSKIFYETQRQYCIRNVQAYC